MCVVCVKDCKGYKENNQPEFVRLVIFSTLRYLYVLFTRSRPVTLPAVRPGLLRNPLGIPLGLAGVNDFHRPMYHYLPLAIQLDAAHRHNGQHRLDLRFAESLLRTAVTDELVLIPRLALDYLV